MFGSKSQARKAELAAIEADRAAMVAAEKTLAAQAAQDAAQDELREQRRAQREAMLADARTRVGEVKERAVETATGTGLIGLLGSALAAGSKPEPVIETKSRFSLGKGRRDPEPVAAASSAKDAAKERAAQAAEAARTRAENARSWAEPKLESAREKGLGAALPVAAAAKERGSEYLDKGIERAAPRVNAAANNLQPQVDVVRNKIVDEYLPRLVEAANAAAAAAAARTDDAAERSKAGLAQVADRAQSQVEVVEDRRSGGRTILLVGALGAGAVAAYSAWRASQPTEDPWAVATAAAPSSTTTSEYSTSTTTPAYSTSTPEPMPESTTTSSWTNPADSTSTVVAASATGEGISSAVSNQPEEETPFTASLNNPQPSEPLTRPVGSSFDEVRPASFDTSSEDLGRRENDPFVRGTDLGEPSELPHRTPPISSREHGVFPAGFETSESDRSYRMDSTTEDTVHLDDDALRRFRNRDNLTDGDN